MNRCKNCDAIVVPYGLPELDKIIIKPDLCFGCFVEAAKEILRRRGLIDD